MSIYLVDTSTSRDVHINDALVNQGLALCELDTPSDEMGKEVYCLEGELHGVSMRGGGVAWDEYEGKNPLNTLSCSHRVMVNLFLKFECPRLSIHSLPLSRHLCQVSI